MGLGITLACICPTTLFIFLKLYKNVLPAAMLCSHSSVHKLRKCEKKRSKNTVHVFKLLGAFCIVS